MKFIEEHRKGGSQRKSTVTKSLVARVKDLRRPGFVTDSKVADFLSRQ
jgi:hypothetical protein